MGTKKNLKMSASQNKEVEFDKSLLFGEMENPFGSVEGQKPESTDITIKMPEEEQHIQKPFKGELTLDEPLKETIKRDVMTIYSKLRFVLNIKHEENDAKELKNWDLWGPFALCLILAITLSVQHGRQVDTIFSSIFLLVCGGSMVLTLNARLLGSKVSLFQNACVLGYCLFPLIVSSLLMG